MLDPSRITHHVEGCMSVNMVTKRHTTQLTENIDQWLKSKLILHMMVDVKGKR